MSVAGAAEVLAGLLALLERVRCLGEGGCVGDKLLDGVAAYQGKRGSEVL